MTTSAAPQPTPVSHLRLLPRPSVPRRIWNALGWNFAIVLEVVALVLLLQFLIADLGLFRRDFIPAPSDIVDAWYRLAKFDLLTKNITFSLGNFAIGYVLAAIFGILLGLGLGTLKTFRTLASPIVWTLYATPRIALAPLFIMWFGFGSVSKIAVIFLMALFPILVNVWVGADSVDRTLLQAGRVFGGRQVDLYRKVVLPYILPYTLTGLRLGIARGLVGVVVAEFIGSVAGVGYMIGILSSEFDIAGALALTLVLMVTANVSMIALDLIRRRLAPWYREGAI